MTDEPDYLDIRRNELFEEYERTYLPKVEAAHRRRRFLKQTAREVAVSALSTIIGGATLAGGAVAVGWVGSDPTLRSYAGVGAILLTLILVVSTWTASKPLDTHDDHLLVTKIRQMDALIAERDERRATEVPDDR